MNHGPPASILNSKSRVDSVIESLLHIILPLSSSHKSVLLVPLLGKKESWTLFNLPLLPSGLMIMRGKEGEILPSLLNKKKIQLM